MNKYKDIPVFNPSTTPYPLKFITIIPPGVSVLLLQDKMWTIQKGAFSYGGCKQGTS